MHLRTIFSAWLVVALAVLWTCAASASASVATTGEEIYTGPLEAESSNLELDGTIDLKCSNSTIEGEIESHGPEAWVSGPISGLAFSSCGKDTVTVAQTGVFSLSDTGTLRSTGAEFTVQIHRTIFGFPITTHCIYKTNNTQLGTLTGSETTGSQAVVDIESATIPQSVTDGACGEVSTLTGTYKVTTPATLDLVAPATTLCKEQPKNEGGGKLKCPAGQSYAGEVIAELTGPGSLKGKNGAELLGTISCEKIELAGKFAKDGQPEGGVSKFTLTANMEKPCPSSLPEEPQAAITMQELPYERSQFLYVAINSDGSLMLNKQILKEKELMLMKLGEAECKYQPAFGRFFSGDVVNGVGATPTFIDFDVGWSRKVGGALCPPEIEWDFKLNLFRPGAPKGNLYLASE